MTAPTPTSTPTWPSISSDRWGVVILTNFDSLNLNGGRLQGLSSGVISLLHGEPPPQVPSPHHPLLAPATLLVAVGTVVMLLGIVRTVLLLRRWRTRPESRPQGPWAMALRVGLPFLANVGWGLALLLVFPKLAYPLRPTMLIVPDLGYLVVASGLAALTWGSRAHRSGVPRAPPSPRAETRAIVDAGTRRSASRELSRVETLKRHPVLAYFVLAYVLTWWMFPLLQFSPLLGLLGLFGPALAAIIMAAVLGGRSGVTALLERVVRWRVGGRWYVLAVGLPALLALTAAALAVLLGVSTSVQIGALSVLDFVIFIVVVGEELGWRGFALPCLLQQRSALSASLILGVLWSAWHLPTFLVQGTPQYGKSVIAFVLMTTAYSVLLCWIFLHTEGSVLIATLVHGSLNLFHGMFLGGVDPAQHYWLLAGVYWVTALVLVLVFGPGLSRRPFVPAGSRSKARAM